MLLLLLLSAVFPFLMWMKLSMRRYAMSVDAPMSAMVFDVELRATGGVRCDDDDDDDDDDEDDEDDLELSDLLDLNRLCSRNNED